MPEYDTIRDMKMCLKFFLQIFFAMSLISLIYRPDIYCIVLLAFGSACFTAMTFGLMSSMRRKVYHRNGKVSYVQNTF